MWNPARAPHRSKQSPGPALEHIFGSLWDWDVVKSDLSNQGSAYENVLGSSSSVNR